MKSKTAVFLQDACYQHRFIRSPDLSSIVERPERLRALKIGIAAAIARIEEATVSIKYNFMSNTNVSSGANCPIPSSADSADAVDILTTTMQRLELLQDREADIVEVVKSTASVDLLKNIAVKYVHGDIEGDVYLENLVRWVTESMEKINTSGSEIPPQFHQGDLYCTFFV